MRLLALSSALCLLFLLGCAEAPAPAPEPEPPPEAAALPGGVQHWSAADLAALPADLHQVFLDAPKDNPPYSLGVSPRHLIEEKPTANHYMDVVHRERSGIAEWHEVKADYYFVLDGEATVTVGGEMADRWEMQNRPGEWRADEIAGGQTYALAKGDMINIPSRTPHWVQVPEGKTVTYLIVKVIDDPGGNTSEVRYIPASERAGLPAELAGRLDGGVSAATRLLEESDQANHYVLVAHRTEPSPAEWHDDRSDLYLLLEGEGEITLGGDIPGKAELDGRPGEWRGPAISGGQTLAVSAGDMLNIPSKTAHHLQFSEGSAVTYLIVKVLDKE